MMLDIFWQTFQFVIDDMLCVPAGNRNEGTPYETIRMVDPNQADPGFHDIQRNPHGFCCVASVPPCYLRNSE